MNSQQYNNGNKKYNQGINESRRTYDQVMSDLMRNREEQIILLKNACQVIINGYEDDGFENMQPRDDVFYRACKDAIRLADKIDGIS